MNNSSYPMFNPYAGPQNMMGGHSGMPTPMQYNPYAQYYSSPFKPVDMGMYSPGYLEMFGMVTPRNLARNEDHVAQYREEAKRRLYVDTMYNMKVGGMETAQSAVDMLGEVGSMAALFKYGLSPQGWLVQGALGAAQVGARWGIDRYGVSVQEDRYTEILARNLAGNRGARALGNPLRGRFDISVPDDLGASLKKLAKKENIPLKDLYEMTTQSFHSGVLSLDGAKELPKRIKEIVDSAVEIARDLGTTVQEANKYASELSARGFHKPQEVARNFAKNIRRTVDATDLDSRFVSQMGNLGFQMAMNFGTNPQSGANLMVSAIAPMQFAKENPIHYGDLQPFAMLGGVEGSTTAVVQKIMSSINNPHVGSGRALLSAMQKGAKISSSVLASERRNLSSYTLGQISTLQENSLDIISNYFMNTNEGKKFSGKNLQRELGKVGAHLGMSDPEILAFTEMMQQKMIPEAFKIEEGQTGREGIESGAKRFGVTEEKAWSMIGVDVENDRERYKFLSNAGHLAFNELLKRNGLPEVTAKLEMDLMVEDDYQKRNKIVGIFDAVGIGIDSPNYDLYLQNFDNKSHNWAYRKQERLSKEQIKILQDFRALSKTSRERILKSTEAYTKELRGKYSHILQTDEETGRAAIFGYFKKGALDKDENRDLVNKYIKNFGKEGFFSRTFRGNEAELRKELMEKTGIKEGDLAQIESAIKLSPEFRSVLSVLFDSKAAEDAAVKRNSSDELLRIMEEVVQGGRVQVREG